MRPPREIACELVEDFWNRGGLCTQEYAIDKISEAIRVARADASANVPPVAGDNAGLVERLRNMEGTQTDAGETYEPLCLEAADKIEALEAQVALLGASLTKQQGEIDGLEAERARLREALDDVKRFAAEAYACEFPVHGADIARLIARHGLTSQAEFADLVEKHDADAANAIRAALSAPSGRDRRS